MNILCALSILLTVFVGYVSGSVTDQLTCAAPLLHMIHKTCILAGSSVIGSHMWKKCVKEYGNPTYREHTPAERLKDERDHLCRQYKHTTTSLFLYHLKKTIYYPGAVALPIVIGFMGAWADASSTNSSLDLSTCALYCTASSTAAYLGNKSVDWLS